MCFSAMGSGVGWGVDSVSVLAVRAPQFQWSVPEICRARDDPEEVEGVACDAFGSGDVEPEQCEPGEGGRRG